MKKPRVAILTPLVDFSTAYSLTGIILDQARMLERAGYEHDLLVLAGFNKNDRELASTDPSFPANIKFVLPQTKLHDYGVHEKPHEDFEEQVDIHYEGRAERGEIGYRDVLKDYDVVVTHDLMFLGWHLPQNQAIRRCVELYPEKRWLHWLHSAPSGQPPTPAAYPSSLRFQGCENSLYVYLNHTQKQDVVNHFSLKSIREVAVVYNPKDMRDWFDFAPETCGLIDRHQLLDHQIFQVYPFSTPRWRAKGVHKLLRLWGYWRRMGLRAKLVLANAHCTQEKDEAEVRKMEDMAQKWDLTPGLDVVWTSRFAADMDRESPQGGWKRWQYSVPQRVVRELMMASNVFVFPTDSECCSLIQAEAAISGKLLVLNRNIAQLTEFVERSCLGFDLANDPDRNPAFWEALARELWGIMQNDPRFMSETKARTTTYNRDWIWRHQLEPLVLQVRDMP